MRHGVFDDGAKTFALINSIVASLLLFHIVLLITSTKTWVPHSGSLLLPGLIVSYLVTF